MKTNYEMYLGQFINYMKNNRGMSQCTINTYKSRISLFLNWVTDNKNHQRISSITRKDLEEYLSKLDVQPQTYNTTVSAIEAMWKWLIKNDYTSKVITFGIDKQKVVQKPIKYLDLDEAKEFIKACENYDSPNGIINIRTELIAKMFLLTGMRVFEMANIEENKINLDKKYVRIKRKGAKEADIPLHDILIELIQRYLEMKPTNTKYLFNGDKKDANLSVRSIQNYMTELLRRIGRDDLTTHDLRKSYTMIKLEEGVDLLTLKKALDHSSIQTTTIYAEARNKKVEEANMNSSLF